MNYSEWGRAVSERFPSYKSAEAEAAWASVKERFAPGNMVAGIVVARAPFGAWIDLGAGFPGLLEIINIEGLTPERYQAGDWCPVGSEVKATIGGLLDRQRQIGLWQVRLSENQNHSSPE